KTILNSTLLSYIKTTLSSKLTVDTTTLVNNIISIVTSVLDSTISSWATNYVSIVSGDTHSVLFAALMIIVSVE
ncbi:hypothetical protein KSF78_0009326, partial [Schistosoma japonicum]